MLGQCRHLRLGTRETGRYPQLDTTKGSHHERQSIGLT